MLLEKDEKLSIVYDTSGDQPERFPCNYYICVVLKCTGKGEWYNSGIVLHIESLNDLEAELERAKSIATFHKRAKHFQKLLGKLSNVKDWSLISDASEPNFDDSCFYFKSPTGGIAAIHYYDLKLTVISGAAINQGNGLTIINNSVVLYKGPADNLLKCNNCEFIGFDDNLVDCNEDGSWFKGCPNCKDDQYLMNNFL